MKRSTPIKYTANTSRYNIRSKSDKPSGRKDTGGFFFYTYLRSADFLSRLFALTMQLRPTLYLPVAATTSNRVRTKILELIGVKPQISSKYNFKNLRNYLHISKKMRIFALDFKSVLFPVWSNRLWPYIPMSYNRPLRPATAST